ncbi:MAG: hypothetical protein ACAH23_09705, partial [Nitrososphaeraceae archaeon]
MQKELLVGLLRSRRGIIGISIIGFLLLLSAVAPLIIPIESYFMWSSPDYWINNPKTAAPSWTNFFGPKDFEHVSLDKNDAKVIAESLEGIRAENYRFEINMQADSFPDDIIFLYSVKYSDIPPVLQIDISRPDNNTFTAYYSSLPPASNMNTTFSDRIFSTNENIKEALSQYQSYFNYSIS